MDSPLISFFVPGLMAVRPSPCLYDSAPDQRKETVLSHVPTAATFLFHLDAAGGDKRERDGANVLSFFVAPSVIGLVLDVCILLMVQHSRPRNPSVS